MRLNTRFWLFLLLAAALLWAVFVFQTLIIYLIVAGVLSLIGRPLMRFFGRLHIGARRMPSAIAAVLTLTLMFGTVSGVVTAIVPPLATQVTNISKVNTNTISRTMDQKLRWVKKLARKNGIKLDPMHYIQTKTHDYLDEEAIGDAAGTAFSVMAEFIVGFFCVAFITFFFLKDHEMTGDVIRFLTPDRYAYRIRRIIVQIRSLLSRYFIALLLEFFIVSVAITGILFLLGAPNALLLGIVGGLLNIVPFVGPWIAAVLGILLTLLANLNHEFTPEFGWWLLQIGATFVGVHFLDSFGLQPYLYSNSVKAHPLEIFLVTLAAGTIGGIGGMVVAIPAYTIIRVIAKESYQLWQSRTAAK